mgnify:CR=1 FL=1
MRRKGQATGAGAAWLVSIIALFLIIYVILLPESEKEGLLRTPEQVGMVSPGQEFPGVIGPGFRNLLSESPGLVSPVNAQVAGKQLASVSLFSEVTQREEPLVNLIVVEKNLFGEEKKRLTFRVSNVKNVETINLLFFLDEGKGDLIIKLNDHEIYRGPVNVNDIPIMLPKSLLRTLNDLEFSVSSPSFLGKNRFVLRNTALFKRIKEENSKEIRSFVVSRNELASLQSATLFYTVNCFTVNEDGNLRVSLNNKIISEGLIVCDAREVSLDLDINDVIEGRNAITFEIDKGKYTLERVQIEEILGAQVIPSYFFTLQIADIDALIAGAHAVLQFRFLDDGLRKVGSIYVNGFPFYIDTYDNEIAFDITDVAGDGRNVIRVVPVNQFDVVSMDVLLG